MSTQQETMTLGQAIKALIISPIMVLVRLCMGAEKLAGTIDVIAGAAEMKANNFAKLVEAADEAEFMDQSKAIEARRKAMGLDTKLVSEQARRNPSDKAQAAAASLA